jgi:hypothetical protein
MFAGFVTVDSQTIHHDMLMIRLSINSTCSPPISHHVKPKAKQIVRTAAMLFFILYNRSLRRVAYVSKLCFLTSVQDWNLCVARIASREQVLASSMLLWTSYANIKCTNLGWYPKVSCSYQVSWKSVNWFESWKRGHTQTNAQRQHCDLTNIISFFKKEK